MPSMLHAVPRRLWWLALAGGLGGCVPDTGGIDTVDGGSDAIDVRPTIDGGDGSAGLTFEWKVRPSMPAQLADGVVLQEVRLHLRDVRALGDSAPGDSRTSVEQLEVGWRPGESPAPLVFLQAPPGIYSSLRYSIGESGKDAYELRGTIVIGGETYALEVEDHTPLAVTVPLDLELAPGESATLEVRLDAAAILAGVDWSQVEREEDEVKIEEGQPLAAVRAGLAGAFSVAAP